jgi:hypothetical protein
MSMKRVIAAAAALCLVCLPAFAQPQIQTSTAGKGKTFCPRYEAALTIANRTAAQPYKRPPAGCFAVAPDVTVTILQPYPKLPSGGAIWQVQLGSTAGFLAFSLAPSIPPATVVAQPARPSQPAPAAKPSDGTTASLSPAPSPRDEAKGPTDISAAAARNGKPETARETAKAGALSAAEIALVIVQESRQRYYASGHPCACPDDVTRSGRSCGGNSAYSRPGGAAPLCYVNDVSSEMIARYRAKMAQTAAVP